jgi:hypothetical protein
MPPKDYYVTHQGRRWQFEVDGDLFGPYSTEGDAIAAAIADAREALPGSWRRRRTAAGNFDGTAVLPRQRRMTASERPVAGCWNC